MEGEVSEDFEGALKGMSAQELAQELERRIVAAFDQMAALYAQLAAAQNERDAIVAAGGALVRIVEGIEGAVKHGTFRAEKGMRLKDTPEWVAFYNTLAK
jgi:hypothetical protein